MKAFCTLGVIVLLAVTGCSSRRVATLQGRGTREVFYAPCEAVWRAAVDASQRDGLSIVSADRNSGYIAAHRTVRPHTFGENVGIWVTENSPNQTTVEVVSRQAGPPVVWFKNWEHKVLQTVAADLAQEYPTAVGGAPTESYTTRGAGRRH